MAVGDDEAHRLPGAPLDLSEVPLPGAFNYIRVTIYKVGKEQYELRKEKYAFHLGLTIESVTALEWLYLTLVEYLNG